MISCSHFRSARLLVIFISKIKSVISALFLGLSKSKRRVFNKTTNISFSTPSENAYRIAIYHIAGREIQHFEGISQKGINRISVELQEKGVYFYQLICNGQKITQKMMAH